MSTLIKRPNSPYWVACFDVIQNDGSIRRFKKSTKKTKRAEALVEAQRIEEVESKRSGNPKDIKSSKAFDILAEAAEAAAKGELSEARARAFIAQLAECSTGSELRFYTVRQWAGEWLTLKKATTKPATLKRYSGSIAAFLTWIGEKSDARLESITKADARAFRDAIRSGWNPPLKKSTRKLSTAQRTAKTTNHFARDLGSLFRAAVRENLLVASPFTALEPLPEDDSMERGTFATADVAILVTTAATLEWQNSILSSKSAKQELREARSRDWQGMILLGYYAGPRLGDCARFKKENVKRSEKIVSFMPGKTDRKRKKLEIPIHPRLEKWFEEQFRHLENSEYLFPSLAKVSVSGNTGLSSQFVAIMEAAGIDRGTARKVGEGRRAQHSRSFHALRHSLTSALANLDVPEEIRRRIVGHESAAVHQIYTHHERETLAKALEKLPSI